jgi:hypothetical protein
LVLDLEPALELFDAPVLLVEALQERGIIGCGFGLSHGAQGHANGEQRRKACAKTHRSSP